MHRSIHVQLHNSTYHNLQNKGKEKRTKPKFCTHTCTGIGDIVFNCLNLQERIYIIQPHCHWLSCNIRDY